MFDVSFGLLSFDRIPVECISITGDRYIRWFATGMPRIPDTVLSCCFFCFGSEEEAVRGENPRGTGFLVSPDNKNLYAVTNKHVAVTGGSSVIRINMIDGSTKVLGFDVDQWEFLPRGADVAAVSIETDLGSKFAYIPASLFVRKPQNMIPGSGGIFVGDDTFMIGMYVNHQAKTKNMPAARFGNVSMLPDNDAPAVQPNGYNGPCYVVDMRSRTGFSGSPVFAYSSFGSQMGEYFERFGENDIHINISEDESYRRGHTVVKGGAIRIKNTLKLIGILCAQFPEPWELRDGKVDWATQQNNAGFNRPQSIDGVSGMSLVSPAWDILELLEKDVFVKQRAVKASQFDHTARPQSVPPSTDANPTHREDFTSLLNVAAKKPSPAN